MARSRKSKGAHSGERDVFNTPIATRRVSRPLVDLRLIEDRRTFHPEGDLRPYGTRSNRKTTIVFQKTKHVQRLPARKALASPLSFNIPKEVAVCVRRHRRRQVIFATGKGGPRKFKFKRRRVSELSRFSCK